MSDPYAAPPYEPRHPYQDDYAEPYQEQYREVRHQEPYQEQQYQQPYQAEPYRDDYRDDYRGGFDEPFAEPFVDPFDAAEPGGPNPDETLKLAVLPDPSKLRTGRARSAATPAPRPVQPPTAAAVAEQVADDAERAARGGVPTALLVLAPVLATLAMGGWGIGGRQIGQDESATWWAAGLSWGGLGRLLGHTDVVLAPYYALMHLWVSVAGTSPGALRLPSLLAMAAAAGVLAVLGRRMFNAATGLVAGLLLAVLPVTGHAAQDARPYALATLAALLTLLMLYRAMDHAGADRWGGYALMLVCTGLLHLVAAAVVIPFMVLVRVKARDRLGAWAAVTAVCVFPMLAFVLLGRGQTGQGSVIASGIARLPQQLIGSSHGAMALAVLVLLGLCFAGRTGVPLLVWAVVPPVGLFLLRNVTHLFDPSYFVFTVPAWTLLAGAGLCGLVRLLPGAAGGLATRQALLGVVAAAALTALLLPDLKAVRAPLTAGQPDFRSAAQWLITQQRPGDGITYTGVPGTPQRTMGYALRADPGAPKNAFLSQTPDQAGTYSGVACLAPALCAQGLTRIWLLSTAPAASLYVGMSAPQVSLLKLNYKQVSTTNFPGGITLVLLAQIPAKG